MMKNGQLSTEMTSLVSGGDDIDDAVEDVATDWTAEDDDDEATTAEDSAAAALVVRGDTRTRCV